MGQTPPMVIFEISCDVLEFLGGFLTEEITDRREEKSLVHNLESGGSDSPDGDVFKSDADPTLTFVLPTTLSAPCGTFVWYTCQPHYQLRLKPSDHITTFPVCYPTKFREIFWKMVILSSLWTAKKATKSVSKLFLTCLKSCV